MRLAPVALVLTLAMGPLNVGATTFTGEVVDAQTGEPLAGIDVRILSTDRFTQTGADGRFRIENVPSGLQSVALEAGYHLDVFETFQVKNGRPIYRRFTLERGRDGTGAFTIEPNVEGTVTQALTSKPLAGARVTAGDRVVTTDARGRFRLRDLPRGSLILTASAPGHRTDRMSVLVIPNGEFSPLFGLRSLGQGAIRGRVTDAETGEPIAGAQASVSGAMMLIGVSDEEGVFEIDLVPQGEHTLVVEQPFFQPDEVSSVRVRTSKETTVKVSLQRRSTMGGLQGTLRGAESGEPIAGARLWIDGGEPVETDTTGAYTLHDLPTGLVTVSIAAAGYAETIRTASVHTSTEYLSAGTARADFEIWRAGHNPTQVSSVIRASEGGIISTKDGRLQISIGKEALTHDTEIILRTPEAPIPPGERLALHQSVGNADPDVEIRAVGPPTQIILRPVRSGDQVPPELVLLITARYPAGDVQTADVQESHLFPYFQRGDQWTIFPLPIHVVDPLNRLVVAGTALVLEGNGSESTRSTVFVLGAPARRR